MSGYLELQDGRRIEVRDGLMIGRTAPCDVVVADTKASRRHARLHVDVGVVEIEDLQSSNGTLLNDKPVTRRLLRDGDQVRIGATLIVYREGAGTARSSRPAVSSEPLPGEDLFADVQVEPVAPVQPVRPEPAQARVTKPPPVTPANKPAPVMDVIEFADEVIEVRAAPPAGKSSKATAEPRPTGRGVLQFSKHSRATGDGSLLADDMAQMPGWQRSLLILVALVVAVGLGYAVMKLAS